MNQDRMIKILLSGGFVPLTRVKTLVSMTTPRDLHVQNNTILPPFIEFDMNQEGFGCLYLPSLCPASPHSASGEIYLIYQHAISTRETDFTNTNQVLFETINSNFQQGRSYYCAAQIKAKTIF